MRKRPHVTLSIAVPLAVTGMMLAGCASSALPAPTTQSPSPACGKACKKAAARETRHLARKAARAAEEVRDTAAKAARQAAARNSGICDPSLWRAIYHPYRLHVVAACKTVTGTVKSVRSRA